MRVRRAVVARGWSPIREQALVLRQESLERALLQVRTEILEATDQYGREAIDRIHAAKVEELMDIDRKLAELRMEHERILNGPDAGPGSTRTRRRVPTA